jgi:superfamily I DNA and/or RNA helicase
VSKYALDTLVDKAIDNLNKRRDGSTARAFEEQRERRTILERARVVATTTSAAGAEYLKEYKFDAVVVDEAAQSSEAATLIPLMRRASHVKRIILAGDHRQLPAVAHARETTATTAIRARTPRRRSSFSTA